MNELQIILDVLNIERVDDYLFTGNSTKRPPRVFGGQVFAQALRAAAYTIEDDKIAHSMHGYFLRPGHPEKPITFSVDPIRDGRSFATRRVVATQEDKAIFNASVSFQIDEEGFEHQSDMPDVPAPEEVESDLEYWQKIDAEHPGKFSRPFAEVVERRTIYKRDYFNPQPQEAKQYIWFKMKGDIGDDPFMHQLMLAYISDFSLLGTALMPHPHSQRGDDLFVTSLDHAVWFHRSARLDEYVLYAQDGPNANGGRGFNRGSIYTREGVLAASTAQEALMRLRY